MLQLSLAAGAQRYIASLPVSVAPLKVVVTNSTPIISKLADFSGARFSIGN